MNAGCETLRQIAVKIFKMLQKESKSVLYQLDYFGNPINLMINHQPMFHTLLGSIVSVGILVFIFISFINLTQELSQGVNPNVISKTTFSQNPDLFLLTPDNFKVSFVIADLDGKPILNTQDKAFYRVNAGFMKYEFVTDGSTFTNKKTPAGTYMIQCNRNKENPINTQIKLDYIAGSFALCIDEEWWYQNPIRMSGTIQSKIWESLYIQLELCTNSTNPGDTYAPICAPQDEINERMSSGTVTFNFLDNQMDQQKEDPFSPIYRIQYYRFNSQGNIKELVYKLRHTLMYSVLNPFYYFGQTNVHHVLQYLEHEVSSDVHVHDSIILGLHFMLDDQKVEYFRSYGNILSVFASVSGLFASLKLVCSLIILPLSQFMMDLEIVNSTYSFQKEKSQENFPVNQVQKSLRDLRNKMDVLPNTDGVAKEPILKQFLQFKDKPLIQKGVLERIKVFFKKDRRKLFNDSVDIYKKAIDVIYILNKLNVLEKIKQLLFTKQQLRLFDYLPKPTIKSDTGFEQNKVYVAEQLFKQNEIQYFDNLPFNNKLYEALEAYEQISKNEDNSPINSKLINFMDSTIKDAFGMAIFNDSPQIKGLENQKLSPLSNEVDPILQELNQQENVSVLRIVHTAK